MIPLLAITAGLGALKSIQGGAQIIGGNRNLKKLASQRSLYKAPDEVDDMLNLALNNAQSGYGAKTMNFLQSQLDRGLSSGIGAVSRLGGDPNAIAGLIDNYSNNVLKIGAEDSNLQLQKLAQVYRGIEGKIQAYDAEYASKENMLKDEMAREGQRVQAGEKNFNGGVNTMLGAFSANQQMGLFKEANGMMNNKPTLSTNEINTPYIAGQQSLPTSTFNDTLSGSPMDAISSMNQEQAYAATFKKLLEKFKKSQYQ